MLDHPDPAVVGGLRVGRLARRIGGLLVDLGKLDLLELVLLVVDGGPDECRRRHRALRDRLFAVAHQLEVRLRRNRRAAVVRNVERGVDHVAAAMKRQHLRHFVTLRVRRLELQVDRAFAGSERTRARQRLVRRAMVGHALADQPGLSDEGPLGVFL